MIRVAPLKPTSYDNILNDPSQARSLKWKHLNIEKIFAKGISELYFQMWSVVDQRLDLDGMQRILDGVKGRTIFISIYIRRHYYEYKIM